MTGVVLALVGALTAGAFAARLWRQWRTRRRDHALAWALSLTMYAIGMLALAMGLAFGWGAGAYGVYWLTGALINVPLLAVGQLHLLDPARRRLWWIAAAIMVGWATIATVASQFNGAALAAASADGGIPLGANVLAGQPAYSALQPLTLTGTAIVLVGTIWSAVTQRRPAVLLIALGVGVAGSSSAFVRNGLDDLVPVALTVGVAIMYAGFRASVSRRGPLRRATAHHRA